MPSVWQPDGNGFTPAFNVKMNRIHTICRFLQATWLFWIVAVVTFVYLVVRAFYSDLAYDEHWSYLAVFQESGWDLLTFKNVCANNHFLSSVFSMLFMHALPVHEEFAIRLPGILFALLYLYASWKISKRVGGQRVQNLAFLVFAANPFVLVFFGMARGYALALGLQMLSLAALLDGLNGDSHALSNSIWAAFLTVLANLSWLYFFGALCGVIGVIALSRRQHKVLVSLICASLALAVFYVPRVVKLHQLPATSLCGLGALGGGESFVNGTVGSLCKATIYGLPEHFRLAAACFTVALALGVMVAILNCCRKSRLIDFGGAAVIILLLMAGASLLSHWMLNINYLVQRTAMQFIPLFLCSIMFWKSRLMSVVLGLYLCLCVPGLVVLAAGKPSYPPYWFGYGYNAGGQ